MARTLCSVCIATYKRPILLEKLLGSVARQQLSDNVELEIVLVDNDKEKSAQPIAKKFESLGSWPLNYFVQPKKNIALTRNMAVENACGDFIFFIDDDEEASPGWAEALLNTSRNSGADAVFGPIIPRFHDKTPQWLMRRDLYYGPIMPTGTSSNQTYTYNCLVRTALLRSEKGPFDQRYGITGGEDAHLFDRLKRKGARYVNCQEAIVTEFIPPERTNIRYLFIRSLKGGNTYARRNIELAGKKRILIWLWMLGKAVVYSSVAVILMIFSLPNRRLRIKWFLKFASNIGRFMAVFGWYYRGYKGTETR